MALAVHKNTEATLFASAEEAWFWAMAILLARQDGAALGWRPEGDDRPADPEDIVSCCNRLYQDRKISLAQARVLRFWGERQCLPNRLPERDHRLWQQAMAALEWMLRSRGIVV